MADLSRVGEIVRRHDPDRFFTALFAPADRRETLFVLYAFNHELARAREAAREPMMALIRLQWWREVVEGARRQHEVAGPLSEALDAGSLRADDLLPMIEGREAETAPIETCDDWSTYVRATAGGVAVAAGRSLGADGAALDAMRDLGSAYGAGGIIRSLPAVARQGRCLAPQDLMTAYGVAAASLGAGSPGPGLQSVVRPMAELGLGWLEAGRGVVLPRRSLAAALPAVLARYDLRAPAGSGPRGVRPRLAVSAAAVLGRL